MKRYWSFDTETHLIQPGVLAPRMVCLSSAFRHFTDDIETGLVLREQGMPLLIQRLQDPETAIVGANLPYDFGVACAEDPALVPLVFDAYAAGRAQCVQTLQKLMDVALGMRKWRRVNGRVMRAAYGLDALVELYFGRKLEKLDTWRLRYSELDGVPIKEWPVAAREYAIGDAVEALLVREAQDKEITELWGELPNQAEQQRAAWALYLMSMWGVRAEQAAVDKFEASCREHIAKMHDTLINRCQHCGDYPDEHDDERCRNEREPGVLNRGGGYGWESSGIFQRTGKCRLCGLTVKMHAKRGGGCSGEFDVSRVMAEIKRRIVEGCERAGVQVPMTEKGNVQTDKDAVLMTDDPMLTVLSEEMVFSKQLDQWGPVARAAVHRPVCARYNVLVDTGRTSCSGDKEQVSTNFQNPNRKGDVRACFVPRRGWVMCPTDADTIELVAHAQNCLEMLGRSRTAEILIARASTPDAPDAHEVLAASIVTSTPVAVHLGVQAGDKEMEAARQFAKIPQYGFIGGLGPEVFIAYAAGQLDYEVFLRWFGRTKSQQLKFAKFVREAWFETYPENRDYFRLVSDQLKAFPRGEGIVRHPMSGRIRGGSRFTGTANGYMQGRVADAEKDVVYYLSDECYTGRCTSKHRHGGSELCTHDGRSILFGSRPIMFLHDEPIVEHPEDGTESDRAERQRQITVEHLQHWMPAIPCSSTPVLMRRWHKGAKPVRVGGKLVPSMPAKVEGKTRWVHDARLT